MEQNHLKFSMQSKNLKENSNKEYTKKKKKKIMPWIRGYLTALEISCRIQHNARTYKTTTTTHLMKLKTILWVAADT